MSPLVSIVVPVYNVEMYLEECIKSILEQSYKNFELILVDDGSTDSCGLICDQYAKNDNRIKVIHKKNGGLSDARNSGINIAKGELITFIDSDDYIAGNYLNVLVEKQLEYEADIVQGEMTQDSGMLNMDSQLTTEIMNADDAFSELLRFERVKVYACGKVYRKSLLKDNAIYYPVGRLNEDCATTYKLILKSQRFVLIPDVIYFYRKTPNSILNSAFNIKRMELWKVPQEMREYLGNDRGKYVSDLDYYKFRIGVNLVNESISSRIPEIVKKQNEILMELKNMTIKRETLEIKYRVIHDMIRFSPKLYMLLAKYFRERV